jgi:hypothetical protein
MKTCGIIIKRNKKMKNKDQKIFGKRKRERGGEKEKYNNM